MTDPAVVLSAAARYLEARSRTEREVSGHLLRAGYAPDLVAAAVERLRALGYLDDSAFARSWLQSRDRSRPRGEQLLRRELLGKGVPSELIVEALAERRGSSTPSPLDQSAVGSADAASARLEAPGAELAAAMALLDRRARRLGSPDERWAWRRRAYALLARNGFDPDTCREAVDRASGGADAPPHDL